MGRHVIVTINPREEANHMRASKPRMIFTLLFALIATTVTWLVLSHNSPMADYFLFHVGIRNVVGRMLFVPYLILLMLNLDTPDAADLVSYVLAFLQWLLLGYVIARLILRFDTKKVD